ncbi:MAG: hypothetical protein RIF32_13815 [Leptospirales bacterium]|jgi:Tfp pilus assembly protein PilX
MKSRSAGHLGMSIALALTLAWPVSLAAKCFSFSDADGVKVCVDGNNNAARTRAENACKKATGSKCGNITGYSGSCQKSSGTTCIDENGEEQKRLKGS